MAEEGLAGPADLQSDKASALPALALLALPFLERSSPSFTVDVTTIILLLAFIALLLAYGRRVMVAARS